MIVAKKIEGVKPRRLDRRNPFEWYTRRYGYFAAFLKGNGKATREQLLESCLKTRAACGITTDTEAAVKKDIADHVYEWKKPGHEKGSYKLTVKVAQDGTLTCTHVGDQTWAAYLKDKVR